MSVQLLAVNVGAAVPYARGSRSGIDKQRVAARVHVGSSGLVGDEQGDLRVHGGPDKAVHHYAHEHYSAWEAEIGPHPLLRGVAAFGENLSTRGMTEQDVCIGDRFRVGEALLEVTQARQPCWKLDERFGHRGMARRVQQSGRTGWYYRVLEEGEVWAGAPMVRVARPYPEWSLARLLELLYLPCLDPVQLRAARALPLPPSWQRLVDHRLESGQVERWERRLDGPAVDAAG